MTELVVFDTNIWVSGLLWRGAPYGCLLLARAGAVIPAYCNEMVAELAEKLRTKFAFSDRNVQAVIRDYRQVGRRVEITGQVKVVADDPTDDKFVECALVAGAARIVFGRSSPAELGGIPRSEDSHRCHILDHSAPITIAL